MRFEFATATRIIFGRGTIQEVAPLAAEMGSCVFVVTGRTVERAQPLLEQFLIFPFQLVQIAPHGLEVVTSDLEKCVFCHF